MEYFLNPFNLQCLHLFNLIALYPFTLIHIYSFNSIQSVIFIYSYYHYNTMKHSHIAMWVKICLSVTSEGLSFLTGNR